MEDKAFTTVNREDTREQAQEVDQPTVTPGELILHTHFSAMCLV